jgi:hypothetical protein
MQRLSFRLVCSFLLFVGFGAKTMAQAKKSIVFSISNPTAVDITDKVFEVSWNSTVTMLLEDTASLIITDVKTNKQVVFQLETKGTNAIQNILMSLAIDLQVANVTPITVCDIAVNRFVAQ